MTHVVLESCIRCKYTDCVDVCPVDCFREGPNMLVIDPDECIDCAVCIPECPVNAILPEEDVPTEQLNFIKINADLSRKWPSITKRKAPLPDADDWKDKTGKLDQLARCGGEQGPGRMNPPPSTANLQAPAGLGSPIETDAVIVGAGPVGLFQVFELGLLEIKCHIVDSLAYPGGQCIELYPDKPIYDIPAVPVCTGKELTDNLLRQIEPFGATFHLGQEVTVVQQQGDGRFFVQTSKGTQFLTKTLFIAGGVGSFQPRTLKVDGLEKFEDTQLFYRVRNPAQFAGRNLVIVGGGDSALDWALNFAAEGPNQAESVILVHRRDGFKAAPASVAKMKALCEAYEMQFVVGQVTGFEEAEGRLARLKLTGADGVTRVMPLDMLLVFFGLSPKLGPIADWGLGIDRKQLVVDTEKFQTNIPGIFAVGDINTYPGKKKLILSGFHEAALAAFGAAPIVFPEKRILLQYTTTSPKLHKVLGVESPVFD